MVTFVALIGLWHGLQAAFVLAEVTDPGTRATHRIPAVLGHLFIMTVSIVLLAS